MMERRSAHAQLGKYVYGVGRGARGSETPEGAPSHTTASRLLRCCCACIYIRTQAPASPPALGCVARMPAGRGVSGRGPAAGQAPWLVLLGAGRRRLAGFLIRRIHAREISPAGPGLSYRRQS